MSRPAVHPHVRFVEPRSRPRAQVHVHKYVCEVAGEEFVCFGASPGALLRLLRGEYAQAEVRVRRASPGDVARLME